MWTWSSINSDKSDFLMSVKQPIQLNNVITKRFVLLDSGVYWIHPAVTMHHNISSSLMAGRGLQAPRITVSSVILRWQNQVCSRTTALAARRLTVEPVTNWKVQHRSVWPSARARDEALRWSLCWSEQPLLLFFPFCPRHTFLLKVPN